MPTLRANGLEIGYLEAGDGPPLLLLHGASSSAEEDFGRQLVRLGTAFRAVAPDARGHATTRWDVRDGFRYEWLVDDALAIADGLGFGTFHLLGFSMGAATALGVAARAPERLRTLVLVGLSTDRQPRASVARRLFDPDRIAGHDPAWAAELAGRHDPVQGAGAWRRLLPAIAADVAAQQLHGPAELVRVDCPVLIAVGDRDPFVPVDQAWRLRRQLPDARMFVAPDCGHEVMRRHPALWDEVLEGFYTATASTAAVRAAGHPSPVRRASAGGPSSAHAPGPPAAPAATPAGPLANTPAATPAGTPVAQPAAPPEPATRTEAPA